MHVPCGLGIRSLPAKGRIVVQDQWIEMMKNGLLSRHPFLIGKAQDVELGEWDESYSEKIW